VNLFGGAATLCEPQNQMSIQSDGSTIQLDSFNYPTTQAFRWISNVRGYEDLDVVGKNKRATQRPPFLK
jgi:hypothetical protein